MCAHIPDRLTAGDSWSIPLPDVCPEAYPAPPWSVVLVLTPHAGGAPVPLVAAFGADGWAITLGAAASALVAPGAYAWALVASDGAADARATLSTGRLSVAPDPTSGGDPRTQAEKNLAAIDATLADPSWIGAESYTIEGRSLARRSRADLMSLRAHFAGIVRRERGLSPFVHLTPRLAR